MALRTVFICSPYAPVSDDPQEAREERKENIIRAQIACRYALACGYLAYDLDKHSIDTEALDMLKLRLQMAKSSVKKYQAADRCTCEDGRASNNRQPKYPAIIIVIIVSVLSQVYRAIVCHLQWLIIKLVKKYPAAK